MAAQIITTIICEHIFTNGHEYRVTEVSNSGWQPACKPLYFVDRNQGIHDPLFFNIYIGEDRVYAMRLAGAH